MKIAEKSRKDLILGILLALAVVGIGILIYLWQVQVGEVSARKADVTKAENTIKSLKKQLTSQSIAKEAASQDNDQQVTTQPQVDSDEVLIKKTVTAHAHLRLGSETNVITVQQVKQDNNFARASVSTGEIGGYACVLKKADGIWLILFCGQGLPLQSELDQWGVPASML